MRRVLFFVYMLGVSASLAYAVSCLDFYEKGAPVARITSKESSFDIKNIEINKKGEVIRVQLNLPSEIKPGESAVKLSEILKKIGNQKLAAEVAITVTSNFTLLGKGEFFGFEMDINTEGAGTNFTLNLEQNIKQISAEQTFISILTESADSARVVVNLSGELKSKLEGKIEKQRCKN